MISFGIRRLLYWIMHPRIWKIDQNEWITVKMNGKFPKHKTMERKIGISIPWKMNIFIFCSMEQNPKCSSYGS